MAWSYARFPCHIHHFKPKMYNFHWGPFCLKFCWLSGILSIHSSFLLQCKSFHVELISLKVSACAYVFVSLLGWTSIWTKMYPITPPSKILQKMSVVSTETLIKQLYFFLGIHFYTSTVPRELDDSCIPIITFIQQLVVEKEPAEELDSEWNSNYKVWQNSLCAYIQPSICL